MTTSTSTRGPGRAEPDGPGRGPRRGRRGLLLDVGAAGAAALLFAVARVVGRSYDPDTVRLRWAPLYAYWLPHWGPGTPAAAVVAVLVVCWGPAAARTLRWRRLLLACWAGSMAWIWSLALVDGWQRGVARRLTSRYEYLQSVGGVHDIAATLRGFTGHILIHSPDHWPPHVAGHPPGALLTFVLLDRIGLGGGAWAAAWVVTAASSAAVAVLVAVRALASEEAARRAAPFAVLAPAAVWLGVSGDGWFAAVGAWALALLALAATRRARAPRTVAVCSGLLFGLVCYLSYGLVLLGLIALAVLVVARTARPVPYVLAGMLPWCAVFTAAGFWWFDGYATLAERYYQGAAGVRPYGYFVWANLAAQVLVLGPAGVAALRRAAAGGGVPWGRRHRLAGGPARPAALLVLVAGAACTVLLADVSGMSKAETERIWLPFTCWLLPAAALLPDRWARWWLAAQAAVALAVNHLLVTGW